MGLIRPGIRAYVTRDAAGNPSTREGRRRDPLHADVFPPRARDLSARESSADDRGGSASGEQPATYLQKLKTMRAERGRPDPTGRPGHAAGA